MSLKEVKAELTESGGEPRKLTLLPNLSVKGDEREVKSWGTGSWRSLW